MRRNLLFLLLCPSVLCAGDGPPLIVIRDPDPKTARRIRDLVSSKGIGGASARENRRPARRALVAIGPWALPRLTDALGRRGTPARVKQNAVTTITQIEDPLGLPALRRAAADDDDQWVRITACLALGRFARREDGTLLQQQAEMVRKDHARAAVLALAKLRDPIAAAFLTGRAHDLPARRPHLAAATLLAAAIASPAGDGVRHLEHSDDLVRHAAVLGLLIRPLGRQTEETLLNLLDRPPRTEKADIRALQYLALAKSASQAARRRLLEGALREPRHDVQVAALIGLGQTPGGDHFKELKRAYRRINSRSDPLNAPMLYAIARTNDREEAIEFLLGVAKQSGDELRAIYARGSLIQAALGLEDKPRDDALATVANLGANDRQPELERLGRLAQALRSLKTDRERRERARTDFAQCDPLQLHLWDWTPADRHWGAVNRFLPRIFELTEVAERAAAGSRKGGNQPIPKGGDSSKVEEGEAEVSEGKPEHADLRDFLTYEPYFVAEDLLGG